MYYGAPAKGRSTARAAEIVAHKSAASASALNITDTASKVSMSCNLAELGLPLQHTHTT
jgi:hypothetical protein